MLLKAVRERTQLAVQRNDFKLEQVPPHLFMNFRVVDEHGRQLGMGRNLASLKAELGGAGALGLPGAGGAEGWRRHQPPRLHRAEASAGSRAQAIAA